MNANPKLIDFIKEARARGFEDFQIRKPLLENGWLLEEVEKAFSYLKPTNENKSRLTIYLGDDVVRKLEKRANKNMLNLHEQIEDILRRSVLNLKKTPTEEKVDDKFITFFSRKKR